MHKLYSTSVFRRNTKQEQKDAKEGATLYEGKKERWHETRLVARFQSTENGWTADDDLYPFPLLSAYAGREHA